MSQNGLIRTPPPTEISVPSGRRMFDNFFKLSRSLSCIYDDSRVLQNALCCGEFQLVDIGNRAFRRERHVILLSYAGRRRRHNCVRIRFILVPFQPICHINFNSIIFFSVSVPPMNYLGKNKSQFDCTSSWKIHLPS